MKFKDILDFVFSISSYLLRPHYKRSHFRKKTGTVNEWVNHYVHFLGTWSLLILSYCLMVYLFGIEYEESFSDRLSSLYSEPPLKLLDDVYKAIKGSLFINGFFIYVFYKAISSNAERDFIRSHFVHHKLSGLIKVVKMGGFSEESRFAEQSKDQIHNVRRNLKALVSPVENELMVFITASGWDFFGNDNSFVEDVTEPEKGKSKELSSSEKKMSLSKLWRKMKSLFSKEDVDVDFRNGYMLDIITKRYKRVEIILLNPESVAASVRAKSYTEDNDFSHNVVDNEVEYKDGIKQVLKNLALARKKNPHITVKLIDKIPSWKMVKVDREIWVQPIISGTRSDHTTLYGYRNETCSLYHTFFNKIEHMWDTAVDVDWSQYD